MRVITITTQKELRDRFWAAHPEFRGAYRASRRQNEYPTDIRVAWVDWVDRMQRDGEISEALAQRVTL